MLDAMLDDDDDDVSMAEPQPERHALMLQRFVASSSICHHLSWNHSYVRRTELDQGVHCMASHTCMFVCVFCFLWFCIAVSMQIQDRN